MTVAMTVADFKRRLDIEIENKRRLTENEDKISALELSFVRYQGEMNTNMQRINDAIDTIKNNHLRHIEKYMEEMNKKMSKIQSYNEQDSFPKLLLREGIKTAIMTVILTILYLVINRVPGL